MVVESGQKGGNKKMKAAARTVLLVLGVSAVSWAQSATPTSASAPGLDPEVATQAYLAKMTPAQRARSDAYFEGGYWLQLWDFLIGAGIALLILSSGLSARMRKLAEKTFPWKPLQTGFYWVLYL